MEAGKWGDCHMIVKASGRAALILVTGLFACFASPLYAAGDEPAAGSRSAGTSDSATAGDKAAKHARYSKKYTHRKSAKAASKSSTERKAAAADDGDSPHTPPSSEIPPSVADANAQMASADTPAANAQDVAVRAGNSLQMPTAADTQSAGETQIVTADQLNDVDRALHEDSRQTTALAMATAEPPAATAGNENTVWDQTSLIGKIFIGFGALLTMASAARMFMT
jgi:hypothetical protein